MLLDRSIRSLFPTETASPPFEGLGASDACEPVRRRSQGRTMWLLTRHDHVAAMLRDPRFVRTQPGRYGAWSGTLDLLSGEDGNHHAFLRRLIAPALAARQVHRLAPRARSCAENLLSAIQNRESVDLYREYCLPLAMTVTSWVTGFPTHLLPDNARWTEDYLGTREWTVDDAATSRARQAALVDAAITLRRERPGPDLVSELVARCDQGELGQDDLRMLVASLHVTGHVKTAAQLGATLLVLLLGPAETRLRNRAPQVAAATVEEVLRLAPVPQNTHPRLATEDVSLGGARVRRGELVCGSIVTANQDGRHATRGQEHATEHLTFGHGRHFCPGAPLARLVLRVGVTTAMRSLAGLAHRVDRDGLAWLEGFFARGLAGLPVTRVTHGPR
ncbi:hypothetical protein LX15_001084 [Streptoalloteichus tenebrarius]|uniref:Cytochrome P450 n=2 Tax=Streptoalloteichus tenebrarius (strain ATCC 17920 / DSM 40477 / JCM 4838 / CBS 697.72 / NBRC 16177 / NCIMB 11028 / NRRL B-12390 / A12253. 1 / ISP 5477) TaxID=1933 RepID=A0ABT1HPF7_STRSD|nr:hypothetical protein [Streptoalloteichus tenebrarius]